MSLLEQLHHYVQLTDSLWAVLKHPKAAFDWKETPPPHPPGGRVYKARWQSFELMVGVPESYNNTDPVGTAVNLSTGELFVLRGDIAKALAQDTQHKKGQQQ